MTVFPKHYSTNEGKVLEASHYTPDLELYLLKTAPRPSPTICTQDCVLGVYRGLHGQGTHHHDDYL